MTPPHRPPPVPDQRGSGERGSGQRGSAARPAPPPPSAAYAAGAPSAAPTAAPAPLAQPAGPAADAGWASTAATAASATATTAGPQSDLTGRGATSARTLGVATAAPDAAVRAAAAAQARARAVVEEPETRALAGAARRRPSTDGPRRRRRVRPGGLHPGQLVAAEVAVLAGVAAHRQPWPLLVPVLAVVLAVLALCLTRRSGRWTYQWADLGLRHVLRRRSARLPQAASSPALADGLLDAVVDGGWLGRLDLDGVPAALWNHEGGLSVAVEVTATADRPYLSRAVELPPVTALLPAADEGGARFTLQVLEQTHPAQPGDGPAALSYRELTGGAVPAVRRCWVALQVLRGPDDADDPTALHTDLANAVRRVVRRLRKAGLRATPVTPEDAVVGVLGLLGAGTAGEVVVREGWSSWSAGSQHCTVSALALPAGQLDELPAVLAELRARVLAAGTPTMLALAARRADDGVVDTQVTLRVTLPVDQPAGSPAPAALTGRVGAGELRRLDGQQRSGVAATLPLGGFLR